MGKKSKEENAPSDIFKSLFGDSPQNAGLSLFTDNPFRRKPQSDSEKDQSSKQDSLGLGLGSGFEETESPKNGDFANPSDDSLMKEEIDLVEPKKNRKRERERNPNSSSESIGKEWVIGKKQKKVTEAEIGKPNSANPNSNAETMDEGKEIRKKKKRKRDEIEAEYEARKYGPIEEIEDGEAEIGRKIVGEKRKAADDSKEMVVSKEAYDDESKLQRTVFVGNLPLKMKRKALLKEFGQFGEVESVRIRSVPILDTKMPRKSAIFKGKINDSVDSVHAYIVFKDEQSAQSALSHNMTEFGGNHIRVDRACPPRKKLKEENAPLYDNKRTVFVGNLPFDVKDEEVYQLFCGLSQLESSIEAIRVIRDSNTSMGKGIAYVMFKTRDAANLVVNKMHLKLRDRDLRLYHARPDSRPPKRKNPTHSWADNSPKKRQSVTYTGMPSNQNDKPKMKAASLSYQGIRASKSGVQKKVSIRPRTNEHGKFESKRRGEAETKDRRTKRPAVAARKATGKRPTVAARKVGVMKGGDGSVRQTGKKRKLESRTPEDSRRDKRARKFK
ncbi:RNA-binding (RRM/RBD/RNP motifs) family protein [Tasmannia lanceolata]|uniref:RNA-binding (RRM/RBD/RNP motifs) family protein n=1 Tax=Tasmannia lanceolata TaxID=3420 RepID=UPI004063A5F6